MESPSNHGLSMDFLRENHEENPDYLKIRYPKKNGSNPEIFPGSMYQRLLNTILYITGISNRHTEELERLHKI
jgi:hypothetical protein